MCGMDVYRVGKRKTHIEVKDVNLRKMRHQHISRLCKGYHKESRHSTWQRGQ